MDTSVTADVLVTPQPEVMASTSSSSLQDEENIEGAASSSSSSSSSSSCDVFEPIVEFSRRLDDIISTHGSASGLLDQQCGLEEGPKDDITATVETDVSVLTHSLDQLSSPEEKLEVLLRKYSHLADLRSSEQHQLHLLQQKLSRLEAERSSNVAARSKLETLCKELQSHHNTLREEALQRRSEDEEKRNEITSHFQEMLNEIRAQIEQHSARNDKLCRENANLTDKLENMMSQCDRREENLEKIDRHRELQHKLTEAKLQEANALLAAAEDKHKREKEYLLREAIEKTKSCCTMKEQELTMKKKLTLYAQKFDEFQETLAKSNEIYVRFKKEMENMSDKMKKLEKESSLWKTRFENCNKALTDMIEERTEKGKEYELFVLKIQKLEKLCRVLQDERTVLYEKIKEVRHSNSELPSNILSSCESADNTSEKPDLLGSAEIQELQELQEKDPVLTRDMARLKEEQAKLQEFATALLAAPVGDNDQDEDERVDVEEDVMASAFINFKTKVQVKEDAAPVSSSLVELKVPGNSQEAPESDPGPVHTPTQGLVQDHKEDLEQPAPPRTLENHDEDKPMVQADGVKLPQLQKEEEAAMTSESTGPPSEGTGETVLDSNPTLHDSKKQQPKKKKKRVNKNLS